MPSGAPDPYAIQAAAPIAMPVVPAASDSAAGGRGQSARASANGVARIAACAASEIQTTWEDAVSGALANTKPVKEALSEGSKALQAILDRSG